MTKNVSFNDITNYDDNSEGIINDNSNKFYKTLICKSISIGLMVCGSLAIINKIYKTIK